MHSSTLVAVILAAAAATPAIAAPAFEREYDARAPHDVDERALNLLGAAKTLGTGLLGGAAVPLIEHLLGGGDDKSAAAQRRELEVRKSIIGSLLGATEDSLGTVLKTSAVGGLASGAVAGLGKLFGVGDSSDNSSKRALTADEVVALTNFLSSEGNQKRALTADQVVALTNFLSSEGNQKRALTADQVVALTNFLSSEGNQKRALTADQVVALTNSLSSEGNQKRQAEPLTTEEVVALTQLLSSEGNQKRQALTTDEVVALTHFLSSEGDQRRALSSTSKGLIGTAVSLGASALVDPLISGLGKLFGVGKSDDATAPAQRRAITPEQLITAALLSGRAFDDLD